MSQQPPIRVCIVERHQNISLSTKNNQDTILYNVSIIQWSVYKYSLLINAEVNAHVKHQIDIIDDVIIKGK